MARILVVDDQPQPHLVGLLEEEHEVDTATDGRLGLDKLGAAEFDLVISDIYMPTMGGLEFLDELSKLRPDLPVIFMTSQPTVDTAQRALRAGAVDYITKDRLLAEAVAAVNRVLERLELRRENRSLREALHGKYAFDRIIGRSPQMKAVFDTVQRVLGNDSTVLILGDTGTGKEMVAKAIHFNGRRAKRPYVAVNCAAISPHLLESELFGHERGAFTGAVVSKKGLFEEADGGTIFLDEVSEMAKDLQSKLLRVLQEREIQRVGATRPRKIDVRVVAASNRDLSAEVEAGSFRADLYYRLAVVPLPLPALRERTGDVPCLAEHFLDLYCARNGVPLKKLSPEALAFLESLPWPGNVRQLENEIERAVSLREEEILTAASFRHLAGAARPGSAPAAAAVPGRPVALAGGASTSLADLERSHILAVLDGVEGNKSKAAKLLDIDYSTLLRKLKRMGLADGDPEP